MTGTCVPVIARLVRTAIFVALWISIYILFFAGAVHSEPVGWEAKSAVSLGGHPAEFYCVTSNSGLFALVFECVENERRVLYAAVSYDKGVTYFTPVKITESAVKDAPYNPRAVISDEGRILIAWQQIYSDELKYRIFYSFSDNRGGSFSYPQHIPGESDMDLLAQPLFFQNTFYIFSHSFITDRFVLMCSKLSGESFPLPQQINTGSIDIRGSFFPSVCALSGRLVLVWQGKRNNQNLTDDLFCSSSPDGGKSWSVPVPVTDSPKDESTPVLLAVNGTLYCAYQNNEGGNWKIYLTKSLDGGNSWSKGEEVFSTNTNCFLPAMTPAGEGVMIFWQDTRDKTSRVSASVYNPQSGTFTAPEYISDPQEQGGSAVLIRTDERVNCYWLAGGKIYLKRNDLYAPVPAVRSATHPQGKWSNFASAELQWDIPKDDSEIAGFATIVNRDRFFNPTVQNLEAQENSARIPLLPDGISYFHIRTIDKAGNYSRTIHYPLMVSAGLLATPEIQSGTHNDGKASPDRSAEFSWNVEKSDRLKGYLYSLTKNTISTPDKYTDATNKSFRNLAKGRYFFSVRAVDKAGKPGRIATFELLIGEEGSFGAVDYEKIAQSLSDQSQTPAPAAVQSASVTSSLLTANVDVPEAAGGILTIDSKTQGDELHLEFFFEGDNLEVKGYLYSIEGLGIFEQKSESPVVVVRNVPSGDYKITVRALFQDLISGLDYESEIASARVAVGNYTFGQRFFSAFSQKFLAKWRAASSLVFSFAAAFLCMPLLTRIYFLVRSTINMIVVRTKLFF